MSRSEFRLYIPSNVKIRTEFFNGYGVKELIITAIAVISLIPVSIIAYYLSDKNYLMPVIIEMIGALVAIVVTSKDENNLCIASQIQYLIRYIKSQKKYSYKYYNKWRYESVSKE